ncbi:hypothetical protein [Nocardia sp. NPDC050710]|uniref:hypothetical protein n=1 Tax=Nocardia sp. NPDC050710 TaxID=3157220 RepID=UPI00340C2CAA
MTDVSIRPAGDGIWIIAPAGAPTVLDGTPEIDTLVLEALGGQLSWGLLAGQRLPAAVVDDIDSAQEWLWAVYGERVAMAVADFPGDRDATFDVSAEPALPDLAASAWRLGYAHWAARWWPASTVDGITPLDQRLLDAEIATLTEACDLLVDGADAVPPITTEHTVDMAARRDDYALAAGSGGDGRAMTLTRGVGGWDWRRCPPGLIDASERAVSWELIRESGANIVRVRVVAAPQVAGEVAPRLRPRASVRTDSGSATDTALTLAGDTWVGEAAADSVTAVEIYVPGVGISTMPEASAAEIRRRVRDLAAARLRRAADTGDTAYDAPLRTEIAAAASDSDF